MSGKLYTYADLERDTLQAETNRQEAMNEVLKCPKCSCSFFEEVQAKQFAYNHNVIIGQKVPTVNFDVGFILLRCVKCQDLTEPRVLRNARDSINKKYDEFLDEMENIKDEVKTQKL